MTIILTGFMGAGKTSVGELLSQSMNLPVIDIDREIEDEIGMTIQDYFAEYGEEQFRLIEQNKLKAFQHFDGIVSTGGGCIESEDNRRLLASLDSVVYLEASLETIWQRLQADTINKRPLADKNSYGALSERYERRLPFYQNTSDYVINTDNLDTKAVVEEIIRRTQ